MNLRPGQIWVKKNLDTIEILTYLTPTLLVVVFGTKRPKRYPPNYVPTQYRYRLENLKDEFKYEHYELDVMAMFRRLKAIEETQW